MVCTTVPASMAWAEDEVTANTPMPNLDEFQKQVETTAATYEEITTRVKEYESEIADLSVRITDIQDEIPQARERSDEAACEYYRMLSTTNPFLEMVFSATSFTDFLIKIEYSSRVNQSFIDDITALSKLNAELKEARDQLEKSKAALVEEQLHAEEALLDAQNAYKSAEEAAHRIAAETAAATAAAAAAAEAAPPSGGDPLLPDNSTPTTPETPSDKQEYVNLWTPRIDSYLAGSPMAGYGYAFANAAYDYNVDPRWSPAIACIESSKGSYCFLSCNAWGWGQISWPDWETAIYSHVRGLSIGYGYTISEAAARKYCPYNADFWFAKVSAQMSLI